MFRTIWISLSAVVICLSILLFDDIPSAHADMAPPEPPAGSNLAPGAEQTQVQMIAETVIIDVRSIQPKPQPYLVSDVCNAKVTASFTMRNQGSVEETMQARFPLRDPSGMGDGYFNFPEIQNLSVKVDGKPVRTQKIETPNPNNEEDPPVTWAAFDVIFPPGKDVMVDVIYYQEPSGYMPFATFTYILETGAGWKDAIGKADIIVRLPYDVTPENVLNTGYPQTTAMGQLVGNEIRWHFENLEPTHESNIRASIVVPNAWQLILSLLRNVQENPKNGYTWGELAKAYKYILLYPKGYQRDDPAGRTIYGKSINAYIQAITLTPDVARWHAGYAELMWSEYITSEQGQYNYPLLQKIVQELQTALSLDSKNEQALELINMISGQHPEAIAGEDGKYDYLILTALPPTPIGPPPDWTPPALEETTVETVVPTPTPVQELTAQPTVLPVTATPQVEPAKQGKNTKFPFSGCGSAILAPMLLAGLAGYSKQKTIICKKR